MLEEIRAFQGLTRVLLVEYIVAFFSIPIILFLPQTVVKDLLEFISIPYIFFSVLLFSFEYQMSNNVLDSVNPLPIHVSIIDSGQIQTLILLVIGSVLIGIGASISFPAQLIPVSPIPAFVAFFILNFTAHDLLVWYVLDSIGFVLNSERLIKYSRLTATIVLYPVILPAILSALNELPKIVNEFKNKYSKEISELENYYRQYPTDKKIVTFRVYNLSDGVKAKVRINGKMSKIKYEKKIKYPFVVWQSERVSHKGEVYEPLKKSGVAFYGDRVDIEYVKIKMREKYIEVAPETFIGKTVSAYKLETYLGETSDGYLFKGTNGNNAVLVKVIKVKQENPEKYFRELGEEVSNLIALLNHPNLIKLYAMSVDELVIKDFLKGNYSTYLENPLTIVSEYPTDGNLKSIKLDKRMIYKAVAEIASALDYLHSQGYIHTAVSPSSIFLSNGEFKLGGLENAVKITSWRIRELNVDYLPEEVFEGVITPLLDIFSLGITICELFEGKNTRPDLEDLRKLRECYLNGDTRSVSDIVKKGKAKLQDWKPNLPKEINGFVERMVSPDPSKRPTAKEVVKYFTSL
ncbi:hypothetical protein EWF20_02235 [Sulfolobus sp. S-194]|uniref:protein kinase domain-containing protein n=1 Tax=Sulfolobus sp. S-194 TaxID=2512240 RepID=UPI001436F003|nr:protein kinase [Sulfolobus sp. S-194]QIW23090.1 hypothetical protein EWF20_02235 [Sulfolobus sp. S-194]